MRVKQLGNGGGFDFDKTNSSFLIEHSNTTILFDCGFNIMNRLKSDKNIDLEKIENVFISHMDEDHIGNLKMLIYWRYFMYNKITTVICNSNIKENILDYLKHIDSELIGCQNTYAHMFNINTTMYDTTIKIDKINLEFIKAYHGVISTTGVIFTHNKKSIYISADTKANKQIEDKTKDCDLIFHDFSNWDCVTRNVHTCKTDFELEYSKEYQNKVIKYHTGSLDFYKDWRNV